MFKSLCRYFILIFGLSCLKSVTEEPCVFSSRCLIAEFLLTAVKNESPCQNNPKSLFSSSIFAELNQRRFIYISSE